MEATDLVAHKKPQAAPRPSKTQLICDTTWLAVTTVVLLVVFITSGLSNDTAFGFKNSTGDVSDIFFTQVCSNELVNDYVRNYVVID